MPELIIEHDAHSDWQILRFFGVVDLGNFSQFEETIFAAVDANSKHLQLDFEHLQGINSTALGLILATSRKLNKQGSELKIVNVNSQIKAILDLLGSSKRYNDEDDDDSAGAPVRAPH